MFGPPGHLYVYRSYGIHWCANIVCGAEGRGAAVLLRALQPTHGLDRMRDRRGVEADKLLCAGPGRTAQALGLTGMDNGHVLAPPRYDLLPPASRPHLDATPRIGITKAAETPWRFLETGSPWVSRAQRRA